MKQDEIIEMAKFVVGNYGHSQYWPFFTEELEHFAKLVAAKEREACAKVAENGCNYPCADEIAAAIRARSEA